MAIGSTHVVDPVGVVLLQLMVLLEVQQLDFAVLVFVHDGTFFLDVNHRRGGGRLADSGTIVHAVVIVQPDDVRAMHEAAVRKSAPFLTYQPTGVLCAAAVPWVGAGRRFRFFSSVL